MIPSSLKLLRTRRAASLFTVLLLAALCFAAHTPAQKKKPPAAPINLNTASLQELQELPGIGPAAAKKILEMRQKSGAFRSVNDLLAVRGISKNRMEQLRPYVTVSATAKK